MTSSLLQIQIEALTARLPKAPLLFAAGHSSKSSSGDVATSAEQHDSKASMDERTRKLGIATPVLIGGLYMLQNSKVLGPDFFATRFAAEGDFHWKWQVDWPAQSLGRWWLMFIILAVLYSMHLSIATPQPACTRTWSDVWIQFLIFVGDMILIPYYALCPDVQCDLTFNAALERNQRLMARCPTLKKYPMTCWLRNTWLSISLPSFKELARWNFCRKRYLSQVRREMLPSVSVKGGQVAIDWYVEGDSLPDDAPILFVGATMMGDGRSEPNTDFAKLFSEQGWRCCTFVKRGCGLFDPVSFAEGDWSPTDIVSFDEVTAGLELVRRRYPGAFLALAGLSAGGTWVRRYCAYSGKSNVANVAMSLDAGWDVWTTIQHVDEYATFVGKVLGSAMAAPFLKKAATPAERPAWLDMARFTTAQQESWGAIKDVLHRASTGARTVGEWMANNSDKTAGLNQESSVPLLLVASLQDGCIENFYWKSVDPIEELPAKCPNTFVCITAVGGHVYRPSGHLVQENWAAKAALEFFNAVRHEADCTTGTR